MLSGLAALDKKEKAREMIEDDNPLLSACRLVGKSMNIEIAPPVLNSNESIGIDDNVTDFTLEAIARASHIRTREVALRGEWYKEDCGPILGFMEEDDRPVALIPVSPDTYILHDPVLHSSKKVDRELAAQIKEWGFVFFRPFSPKEIKLSDLLFLAFRAAGNGTY